MHQSTMAPTAPQDSDPCAEPPGTTAAASTVRTISLEELVARTDSSNDVLMVMAMDQRRFETAHIEGSISFDTLLKHLPHLDRASDIIVYCTDAACAASRVRATYLVELGFTSVSRFAGGLAEWDTSGKPIATGPGVLATHSGEVRG